MEREEGWISPAILIAVSTIVWATTLSVLTGYPGRPSGANSLIVFLVIVCLAALWRFLRYLFRLWTENVDRPAARIRADYRPALLSFLPILIGIAVICAFMSATTYLKSMIVAVSPFWADAPLAEIDRAIFVNPERIAIALGPALPAFGVFYAFWHIVDLGGILWVLHWRDGNKSRFIVSFMLTWAIGMALAYAFASAGPIFTGRYDPSIAPASVRSAAELLWANYKAGGAALGGGISAFPSMHVAIAAWFALILREKGMPWLGVAYVLGIFAGSIVLGWHYVADGVAGIIVALLADRLAQSWLRRNKAASTLIAQPVAAPN